MVGIRAPQTPLLAALTVTLVAVAAFMLSSCATVVQETKRSLLDQKCQQRVVTMLNAVSPVVTETGIAEKFCACLTQQVDVIKLEADIDGVKEIGINPETLRFVTEYIPTIRGCAKQTGLWKGL